MGSVVDGTTPAVPPSAGAQVDSTASVTNPIKRRIDKLVASKLHNDPEFLKVVDYVAPMVENLDIHTERRLLRNLEKRQMKLNKDYLQEFEKVNAHVQDFAEKVRTMHKICSDLTNRIQQNKEKTQDLLSKTSALQNQKKRLESKQKAIDDFLGRFSLNDHEKRALEGNTKDGTITSDFFPALARAREIYVDSKELLRSSGEHSAAVEIMEEMSQTLEKAYEVLYRSIQRECRILSADYVEMKAVLCQSFAALQEREVLLKYALDEVCTARKNQILRLYIDALTKGTHSNGKPIELMSHDPLRYMGDMLAWIYEALEGEKELLQMLLKECDPQVIRENSMSLLSQISSALCRPFKLRVEQALAGESDSVVLYRLSALFIFYAEKMTPQIGADSELARTVDELNQLTLNIFYSGLNGSVQKILSKMGAPDYDLLPVSAVHQILMLLRDVLDSHDGAMASRQNAEEEFNKIFSCVLDPLYRSVQVAATHLHSPLDVAVYTLNCLSAIYSLVILYPFTDSRLEMIKALMEGNEDVLVSEEASTILANTGLISLYQKAAAHDRNQGPLSAIPGMDASTVNQILSQFDVYLSQPDNYQLDQVAKISSVRTRESVQQRTVDNVVAAYSVVIKKLEDPFNAYQNVTFKSVEQVRELLK
ncbi:Component of oligomeric golgi complex 6 [Trichostrongylus colubriformis]|uniref:Conserved oligomeric Golgi complex subunit 6 n=1 Tax=Trichostrongylus colubriformis TaxID=6319 RepID=A0AAN8FI95_TRICO